MNKKDKDDRRLSLYVCLCLPRYVLDCQSACPSSLSFLTWHKLLNSPRLPNRNPNHYFPEPNPNLRLTSPNRTLQSFHWWLMIVLISKVSPLEGTVKIYVPIALLTHTLFRIDKTLNWFGFTCLRTQVTSRADLLQEFPGGRNNPTSELALTEQIPRASHLSVCLNSCQEFNKKTWHYG